MLKLKNIIFRPEWLAQSVDFLQKINYLRVIKALPGDYQTLLSQR